MAIAPPAWWCFCWRSPSLAFPATAEPPATEQWMLLAFITATSRRQNNMNSRKT
jgi:hypothetical protein